MRGQDPVRRFQAGFYKFLDKTISEIIGIFFSAQFNRLINIALNPFRSPFSDFTVLICVRDCFFPVLNGGSM